MTTPVILPVSEPVASGDRVSLGQMLAYPGAERPRPLKSVAFDLGTWHDGENCVRTFVSGVGGIGVKVCCAPCGVLCDVEGTGYRITVLQSFVPRELNL